MSLPPERRVLQASRGTSTCSELSSPGASLSSGSPMRSFDDEEVCGVSALFSRGVGGGRGFLEGSNNTNVSSHRSVSQNQNQASAPSEPEAKGRR